MLVDGIENFRGKGSSTRATQSCFSSLLVDGRSTSVCSTMFGLFLLSCRFEPQYLQHRCTFRGANAVEGLQSLLNLIVELGFEMLNSSRWGGLLLLTCTHHPRLTTMGALKLNVEGGRMASIF